ncbi:MAG: SPOR domain-containing protein [Mesorhizobium sp.]|nr:SPOR domain-containing protein [Mesorhizobium sp.]MBN9242804.1 SPOR domain-containing protein [Mesorhizobium sp.]
MADRNQLKVADRHGIAEDDPFAELTRIMGFDPRQPVRPQSPVQVVPAEPAHDAFDIDLEKELMGGLAGFEDEAVAEPAPTAHADAMQAGPQWHPAEADHAVAGHAPGLDAAMDEEVAASLEQDFHFEDEAVAHEVPAEMADEEFAAYEAPAIDSHAEPQPGIAPMTDDAFGQALEDYRFDDPVAENPTGDQRDAPVFESGASAEAVDFEHTGPAASVAGATEDDFDAYFENALGDAEEHFATWPAIAETAAQAVQHDAAVPPAEETWAEAPTYESAAGEHVAEEPAFEPVAASAHSEDAASEPFDESDVGSPVDEAAGDHALVAEEPGFDDVFDQAFASGLVDEPAPEPVAAAVAPEPAWPVAAQQATPRENTLEDELNALLSRMTTRPAIPDPRQPAAEVRAGAHSFTQPAARAEPHEADAHEDLDAALLADLQALDFGDLTDEPAPTAPAVSAAAAVHRDDSAARSSGESNWTWSRGTPLVQPGAQPEPVRASAPVAAPPEAFVAPVAAPAYVPETPPAYEPETAHDAQPVQAADDMPDIETVDVPERVVALADDLDLPELAFEQDRPEAQAYDDLDTEFASLLSDMNGAEPAPAPAHAAAYEDDPYGGFSRGREAGAYGAMTASGNTAAAGFEAPAMPAGNQAFAGADMLAPGELDYDPELSEANTLPDMAENEARPRSRGLLAAAVIGAVAVVGGLGAYALSPGGKGSSDAPAIVKADNQPIKVKPENPGGTVIPNQDNKVYDAVGKSAKPAEPTQQKLVTDIQEPMDVAAKQPESRVVDLSAAGDQAAAPMPKSEDRIEPAAAPQPDAAGKQETAVVTPRKVRTMVVKPDGSLVPRDDPAPAKVAASEPADPAPQHVGTSADQTGAVAPAGQVKPAEAAPQDAKPAEVKAKASSATPSVAPIAPQRPSDQPVDVVGEVKPDQVASLDQSAAAPGSWAMQIASQPTAESAQKTYQDLARRYAGVLDGHGVSIVKAEIAGKGTFYRVRVPAGSRNDAVALCTSYKAAGGNCFVSK